MKMEMNAIYLGYESRESKKGTTYTMLGLLQGFQSEELYVSDDVMVMIKNIQPNMQVHVVANVTINGDNSRIQILNIEKVSK